MFDPYNIRNKPQERPWYKPAIELIKDLKPPLEVLDLGCGLGEFSLKLRDLGFEVICVDGSENYVNYVKNLGFQALKSDFNEPLPFKNEQFNIVVCLETIEHIEKAEELVKEIYRILKPSGYLLISTPNYSFLGVRLKILLGKTIPDEGYHFRFFNYFKLKNLLKNSGFKILKENCISFLPFYKMTKKPPRVIKIPFLKNLLVSKMIFLAQKY